MIIQNVNAGQSTLTAKIAGGDAPAVAVSAAPAQTAATQTGTAQTTTQSPTSAQLNSAVNSINRALQQSNQSLEFSVDPTTKTPVVKMVDKETGKVISQYPSEQVLAIAQSIDAFVNEHQLQQGMLLQQKA
jgi:flagellar protein FlaG